MHVASASGFAAALGAPVPDPVSGRAPRYCLRGRLQWRELDGEWVVRGEPSGSLFQLDALSAAVLCLLEAGPQGREALLASLAGALADEGGGTAPAPGVAGAALARALDLTLARLVADDLVVAPARP